MQTRQAQRKAHIVDRVAELLRPRMPAAQRDLGETFLRRFYANVGVDDLAASTPEDMAGAVGGLWQFIARRQPGETKIRVFHPRREEQGWHSPHTIVEIVNDDMPFLVDSVTADLNRQDMFVTLVVHPVFRVRRDEAGNLIDIGEALPAGDGAPVDGDAGSGTERTHAESVMHIQIDAQPASAFEKLRERLNSVLGDVRLAVGDWRRIVAELDDTIGTLQSSPSPLDRDEIRRSREFLAWLRDNHFTFLGYRAYDLIAEGDNEYLRYRDGSGLGVLRHVSNESQARHNSPLSPAAREFAHRRETLIVRKAYDRATVHRAAHMDYIGVRLFDRGGALAGERRFLGLFTSTAYSERPVAIPMLREKLQAVSDRAGFAPGGHSAKALEHILETYPRDELFQASVPELFETAIGILQLQERQRIALFVRTDPFERFLSCLVYVPRDHYSTRLRQEFQRVLEQAFANPCTTFTTAVGDEPLARIHYVIATQPGTVPPFDIHDIESRLVEAVQSWGDRLRAALVSAHGEERGLALWRRYRDAFPVSYTERFAADWAVADIERIESIVGNGRIAIQLYRPQGASEDSIYLKLFHPGTKVSLSDIFPILVNLGVRVVSEEPFRATPAETAQEIWVHDFQMLTLDGTPVDIGGERERVEELLARVWAGEAEDDGFNRLVLRAGLDWREVAMLRAYARYLRQTGIAFSEQYMQDTLDRNAPIARKLVELFGARFDFDHRRHAEIGQIRADIGIVEALEAVENLDEDRILRRFLNLIEATLRTNYYQRGADGAPKPYLSFKLDSRKLDDLPLPHPLYEIWVYAPRVEAVHLRGGKVARGGIRWSDRREDFRTEILGLMKAQMVKNAVIVPVGSKGGFFVKRPPATGGREAVLAEGIACYRIFMRGLLDLTDNIKGNGIVPPARAIRHDDDDPYLVVAADKGTAAFSDIANAISGEYGFWLGDAFASGGSAGYDHKKMAITARGAWESVKRHFREIGRDIGREDFTVIGVGDMAGDVFGNGMLLSPRVKMLAAFNHQHIFIDPDPDPAKSFAERKRLFGLPRSSWADYDRAAISAGGGVFERRAKHIELTAEMKRLFALGGERVTPADLIRALLHAEVDLLWFGGIGTFVKSFEESQADAGDRANDTLRVDARDLRCKIVGEGANLGFTQRGRIEYALKSGRLNTDAIDNSAGVDCSDHEVNIKIALAHVVDAGDMTLKQRDQLLARMTDEVAQLVLRDNYLQTQALSVEEARGADGIDAASRFMHRLERAGKLNRALEFLPDDEALAARAREGRGLTRPELAILLAYGKIALYDELLPSDLVDDPLLADDLLRYFPAPLVDAHRDAILAHRLRREIVATRVTNSIINRVGPTFVVDLEERTGLPPAEIARAYAVARDVFDLRRTWQEIEALDTKVAAAVQTGMLLAVSGLVQEGSSWFLRHVARPIDISAVTAEYGPGVTGLRDCIERLLGGAAKSAFEKRQGGLVERGVPAELAAKIAGAAYLAAACDVVRIASGGGYDPLTVGRVFFDIGERFGLDRLRLAASSMAADTVWEKRAIAASIDDLNGFQTELCTRILDLAGPERPSGGGESIASAMIEAWQAARQHDIERMQRLVSELAAAPKVDIAMLTVASQQLRGLISA